MKLLSRTSMYCLPTFLTLIPLPLKDQEKKQADHIKLKQKIETGQPVSKLEDKITSPPQE